MPIEHLTPLRLICALPPGCPSRDPPLFNLVVRENNSPRPQVSCLRRPTTIPPVVTCASLEVTMTNACCLGMRVYVFMFP
jgi:hypothetical protein